MNVSPSDVAKSINDHVVDHFAPAISTSEQFNEFQRDAHERHLLFSGFNVPAFASNFPIFLSMDNQDPYGRFWGCNILISR